MNRKFIILITLLLSLNIVAGIIYLAWPEKINPNIKQIKNRLNNYINNQLPLTTDKNLPTLVAVGDIMLSRQVDKKMKIYNDYNYPFLETGDYLRGGDIVLGNLETAIVPGREIKQDEMIFRSDPAVALALKQAGFNILSLANNHILNFGQEGLNSTFKYLGENNIKYVGAGNNQAEAFSPIYFEVRGITFAFLAVSYNQPAANENITQTAFMDIKKTAELIKDIRSRADIIIVSMHAGTEYETKPNQQQTDFARAVIEAGADLIIGHHPHVVQTAEKYKGKYIFYSLGNFIFDQMWSQATREGLMVKFYFNFNDKNIEEVELVPILIENYAQPRIVTGTEAENIIKRLNIKFAKKDETSYIVVD